MATHPWLDEVLGRLSKHALPSTYVQRLAEELSDHFQDLKEENMKTETDVYSRLGTPEQVADAAVVAYRHRSFIGRHPTAAFFTFAVLPVVSMIILFAALAVGVKIICMTAEYSGLVSNEGFEREYPGQFMFAVTNCLFSLLLIVIPAIVSTVLFCKLATSLGIGRKWMCVACVILALIAMLPYWQATTIIMDSEHYGVQFGLRIPGICGLWMPTGIQLIQALVPLAIGGWFLWRRTDHGQMHRCCK